VCPKCGRAWFDHGEIAKACGDREIERMVVAYATGRSALTCPRCGGAMATRPVGEFSLDVCPRCKGVWADAGEMERAERILGAEFSDVSVSADTLGLARAALIARGVWIPSPTLRLLLQPAIKRNYPRDEL